MGAVGPVMIFVLGLAGMTILGACVTIHAAACLHRVVEDTACGNDDISWPSEPIADVIARGLPILTLVLIWVAPMGVLAHALREVWLEDKPTLRLLLLVGPGLWLLFPIGLLSSLTAPTPWVLFRPILLVQLLRLFPATFLYYLVSGALAVLTGLSWLLTVTGQPALLLVAAPLGAAAVLIHGRLLGRLAWLVGTLEPEKKKKRRRKQVESTPVPVEVSDPWAVPEEATRGKKRKKDRHGPEDVYAVGNDWKPDGKNSPSRADPTPEEPPPRKPAARSRRQTQEPASSSWTVLQGVFLFPWGTAGLGPWVRLTGSGILVGLGLLLLKGFAPV